jgi:hypothetical protein
MYVNIKIRVENVGIFYPKGFYYKGEGKKLKVVIVGCDVLNHFRKQTFPFKDCEITLTKKNSFGDDFII